MKKLLFFWAGLLTIGLTLCCTSCSKSKDDPVVDPEPEVIIIPLPANPELGKIYPIKHDRKNDTCTFQFYFGKDLTGEQKEQFSDALASITFYDENGNKIHSATAFSPDFSNEVFKRGDDTFTVYCYICEKTRKFEWTLGYHFSDEDFTRTHKYGVIHTQEYRSPHSFYN